jgi:spore germination cell wall hydrolase CwlJ-like protein
VKFVTILVGALAGLAAPVVVLAAAPDNGVAVAAAPPGQIRALIGEETLRVTDQSAVIRIGPSDADWGASDAQDPLTCMTQAVYYEARSESLDGQRGVAQVVLNRTRSGLFPGDVCGVVFERSAGGTCQFSFACDGSMDRPIEPAAWDRARQVADQALHGFVFKPLKDARHFHAAWMTPYWGPTLTRIRQIGGHIFYQ